MDFIHLVCIYIYNYYLSERDLNANFESSIIGWLNIEIATLIQNYISDNRSWKKTTATLKKQHPTSSIVLDDKKTFSVAVRIQSYTGLLYFFFHREDGIRFHASWKSVNCPQF